MEARESSRVRSERSLRRERRSGCWINPSWSPSSRITRTRLFYLGNAYGTSIPMPMWFKHFGKSRAGSGGVGEAYHIGVFGKTGSGKSVLAKMMMMGYAKHPSMSIFVLDPQGEFASDLTDASPLRKVLVEKLGRNVEVYDLHNLVLTDKELFKRILANSGFFEELGIILDANRGRAASEVLKALQPRKRAAKKDDLARLVSIQNPPLRIASLYIRHTLAMRSIGFGMHLAESRFKTTFTPQRIHENGLVRGMKPPTPMSFTSAGGRLPTSSSMNVGFVQ